MSQIRLISAQDSDWSNILARCCQYDFYHLPQYHALAEADGVSVARLAVFEQGDYTIALPFLFQTIDDSLESKCSSDDCRDATSVYGYAGPISSHTELPDDVIRNFQQTIHDALDELNIVCVFSRLHPLINQDRLISGLGILQERGRTVSIDLSLSADEQWRQYSKSLRNRINKLKRLGVTCIHDEKGDYIEEFAVIYSETMIRRQAADKYTFSKAYFENIVRKLGAHCHLFLCQLDGNIICGGMYMYCNGLIQAHLGGVRAEFLKHSPTTLEIDSARLWGNSVGAKLLHLGGGIGAQEDSVYKFKAAFSSTRHIFKTWQWVLNDEIYSSLSKTINGSAMSMQKGFFPAYREPE